MLQILNKYSAMVDSCISALENNVLYYIYWDQERIF